MPVYLSTAVLSSIHYSSRG